MHQPLLLDTRMVEHGVIFNGKIERDHLQFNAGPGATSRQPPNVCLTTQTNRQTRAPP